MRPLLFAAGAERVRGALHAAAPSVQALQGDCRLALIGVGGVTSAEDVYRTSGFALRINSPNG